MQIVHLFRHFILRVMVNISQFDIGRAIGMLKAGLSMHYVAKRPNHDRDTIVGGGGNFNKKAA